MDKPRNAASLATKLAKYIDPETFTQFAYECLDLQEREVKKINLNNSQQAEKAINETLLKWNKKGIRTWQDWKNMVHDGIDKEYIDPNITDDIKELAQGTAATTPPSNPATATGGASNNLDRPLGSFSEDFLQREIAEKIPVGKAVQFAIYAGLEQDKANEIKANLPAGNAGSIENHHMGIVTSLKDLGRTLTIRKICQAFRDIKKILAAEELEDAASKVNF